MKAINELYSLQIWQLNGRRSDHKFLIRKNTKGEEMEELKTVKQVFRDYNSNSFALSEAKVVCVNIYKRLMF